MPDRRLSGPWPAPEHLDWRALCGFILVGYASGFAMFGLLAVLSAIGQG